MIAVSSSGKSFRALAAYLANGRSGEEQDRVAWATSRNLPTDDPALAATFMRATAGQSDRVDKPVYHIALSFDPTDSVDRATMERVADSILERLGLSEHQAVLVAHRDRAHPHVHLLVNRVHPETGKAWGRWKDQYVIQEVLREEEHTLGLRQVPGRLTSRDSAEQGKPERSPPASQTRVPPFLSRLARDLATYERVLDVGRKEYAAEITANAARVRSLEVETAAARARGAEATFRQALASVYLDPDQARRRFQETVSRLGVAEAVRIMRERPEELGRLVTLERSRLFGMARSADGSAARAAAPDAARKGREAVQAERALDAIDVVRSATSTQPERNTREQLASRESFGRLPRRSEIELRLSRSMGRLLPAEVSQLRLLLTAPQAVLAERLRSAARQMLLGQEEARGA